MADNKSAVVGKRFEAECYSWGYETKREHGLDADSKTIETTAVVPAEPGYSLSARLEEKAKAMADSIKSYSQWRNCSFKRFLPEAEQVVALEQWPPQALRNVFAPSADGLVHFEASWWRDVRQGTDFDTVQTRQSFAIPFIQNEDPVATARRVLKNIEKTGSATPNEAITDESERSIVFAFSPSESYFIGEAIKLNQQVEANIEAEKERKAAEQRRAYLENAAESCINARGGHFCP